MPLMIARFQAFRLSHRTQRLFRWMTAAIAAVVVSTMPSLANAESKIVAVVNADPITRNQLADAAVARYGAEVLDTMINQNLILQACKARGTEVTKEEVSAEIKRLASKFGLPLDQYLGLLQEERGISPNQYSTEIIWPMLALRRLAADEVKVSQEEFNQAYLARFGEAVKCRLIMTGERGKAEKLHAQATADPNQFANLAKKFSEDETSASVGGLIPPIRRFAGDTRLEEAAFALEDNAVSPLLMLGDQWIFLQAVRRIPATTPSPGAIDAIKEQLHDQVRDEKMRSAAAKIFSELQTQAKVVTVLGNPELSQKHPGVAALINGQAVPISIVAEACIKRHGAKVLDGEINRKLLSQELRKANLQVSTDEMDAEMARAAESFGFIRPDGQPDIDAWKDAVTDGGAIDLNLYLADSVWPTAALKKLVADQVTITEEDLQQGYVSAYGPRAEVLAIVLSDQRSAQKVWQMARDNPTEEFFGSLAEQYSIEPISASNRGKVPPIQKFGGQPAIEKEVFRMKPGELSGIVVTGGKYMVLRLEGFTEPVTSDPSAVKAELMRDLTEKKMRSAMAKAATAMRESAEIDNFIDAEKKTAPRIATQTR